MTAQDYLDDSGIYAENAQLLLRQLSIGDRENYLALVEEVSLISDGYANQRFSSNIWEANMETDNLVLALIQKNTDSFIGALTLRNLAEEQPEIGIDIVKKYRRQGFGYASVKMLIQHAKQVSGQDRFAVKVYSDNLTSRALFAKLGAVEIGHEETPFMITFKVIAESLPEDALAQLKEKHKDELDIATARHVVRYELKAE